MLYYNESNFSVSRGRNAGDLLESLVKICGIVEAALQGDAVNGFIAGEQQLLGLVHPFGDDVVPGGEAVQLLEQLGEVGDAHIGHRGKPF